MSDDTDMLYLDHNATTPVLPEVVDAMLPWLRDGFGNPSSAHALGRRAKQAVDDARAHVATLVGASPEEIFFTSGGTEANNLAIFGVVEAARARGSDRRRIVTTNVEHPATAKPCARLERRGHEIIRLAVDATGRARLDEAALVLDEGTLLLTVMHSNNETGVLQPVAALASVASARGALVHTDAAQSVGKVPVRVAQLGVDLLSIAGHKLYAPKGVGALYVRAGTPIEPYVLGAGHERGLRPGTENVASIVGLGRACALAERDLDSLAGRLQTLRDRLLAALVAAVPGVQLNGDREQRLPNTLSVRFPRASGTALLAAAPGIAASTGSACHEGGESASDVILAMGVAPEEALGTVRLSLGRSTTQEQIDSAAALLISAWCSVAR
jgi:cysteine desulfurase